MAEEEAKLITELKEVATPCQVNSPSSWDPVSVAASGHKVSRFHLPDIALYLILAPQPIHQFSQAFAACAMSRACMVPSNMRSNLSSKKLGRFCKSKLGKVEAKTVKMLRAVGSAELSKSGPPRWPYYLGHMNCEEHIHGRFKRIQKARITCD